jgi:glutathione peroxidase
VAYLLKPSAQFASQEPANDEDIATFCVVNHGVTFPLMKKSDVNGDKTNEVFKWLKAKKAGILGLARIKVCDIICLHYVILTERLPVEF